MKIETPDYWIAYLRRLAEVQSKQQVAGDICHAADSFADLLDAARQRDELLALLRELIDIEGPQPGHVMWARKVQDVIAKATTPR